MKNPGRIVPLALNTYFIRVDTMHDAIHWIAFEGYRCLAQGAPDVVAATLKRTLDAREPAAPVLIFERGSGRPVELDLRGSLDDVLGRLRDSADRSTRRSDHAASPLSGGESESRPAERTGPGRRKLGVVAREVTLLPRHWEWLASRPGGASATLRRLVDRARADSTHEDRVRESRESAYRFMSALAGNLPQFEEATRALFAGDGGRFAEAVRDWPTDVAAHARELARGGLDQGDHVASTAQADGG